MAVRARELTCAGLWHHTRPPLPSRRSIFVPRPLTRARRRTGSPTAKPKEAEAVSWGEMLSGTKGKLVGIGCMLFVIQQFSGINAIVYFSSSVFREAGLKSEALASAAVGVINVLGSLVAASLMDKKGRKCVAALDREQQRALAP